MIYEERNVQQAVARLRRESRWYVLRTCGSLCCILLAFAAFFLIQAPPSGDPNVGLLLCCLLCLIVGGMLFPRSDSKSLTILAEAPDARMIGALLEALEVAPESKSRKIHTLLILLLPQMCVADAAMLNNHQRRILYDALLLGDPDREKDYLLAVLQAVIWIETRETLMCLRQIVQRGAVTEGQQCLLEAASECLRVVEVQQAQQHTRNSLLRASSSDERSTELLRATQSRFETSPHTLLRPNEE